MRKRDDLTFPFVEYERRLKELRERMAERRLDAVVITDPENLMYLTDYQTTGYSFFQALVVPLESDAFMITRAMEESNVHARTWVDKTRPYPDTGDAIQMLVESLREFGLNDKNIGYERNSYFFPAYHQDSIHTTLLDGRLLDCFGIVEEGRVCKSEYEIDIMKRAAAATEAGMKAGLKAAAAGVTENDIGAAICSGMFRAAGGAALCNIRAAFHDWPRHLGRAHGAAGRARVSGGRRLLSPLSHRHDAHCGAGQAVPVHAPRPGAHETGSTRNQGGHWPGHDGFRRRQSGQKHHHRQRGRRPPDHPLGLFHRHCLSAQLGRGLHHQPQARRLAGSEGRHGVSYHSVDVGGGWRQDGRHLRHHPSDGRRLQILFHPG